MSRAPQQAHPRPVTVPKNPDLQSNPLEIPDAVHRAHGTRIHPGARPLRVGMKRIGKLLCVFHAGRWT